MSSRIDNPALFPLPTSRRRLWPIRAIATISLLVQSVSIYGIVFFFAQHIHETLIWLGLETADSVKDVPTFTGFSFILLLKPLSGLVLLGAVGIAFGRWGGWLIAMLAQGFILYVCLFLYLRGQAMPAMYVVMLMTIVMVLFLNSTGVRMLFPAGLRTVG